MRAIPRKLILASIAVAAIAPIATGVIRRWVIRTGPPVAEFMPESRRVVAGSEAPRVFASFDVANTGGRTLILKGATTSCGCSIASIRPDRLASGQKGFINVEGRPPSVGEQVVEIKVLTNDPRHKEVTLRLTMVGSGKVPYINGSSGVIRFGSIRVGVAPEEVWVEAIEPPNSKPWIARVSCPLAGLVIRGGITEELPYTGAAVVRRYRYTAKFEATPGPGDINAEVVFYGAGSDPAPLLKIPVSGVVRPAVYATPKVLFANLDPLQQPPTLCLSLAPNDTDFHLEALPEADAPEGLIIRQRPRDKGPILFEITPEATMKRSLSATLVFKTNHPATPRVRVPITLRLPGG